VHLFERKAHDDGYPVLQVDDIMYVYVCMYVCVCVYNTNKHTHTCTHTRTHTHSYDTSEMVYLFEREAHEDGYPVLVEILKSQIYINFLQERYLGPAF
jgi:hypothetical protein